MSSHILLRRAVRRALFCGLAISVCFPQVQAQEQETAEIETIFVTGSAIRRIEGETSLPVQILDSAAIEETGASSVVDLLQKLPTIQGGTSEITAIGAATFGFAGVSVHNVGENRTLVLLNGRRMAQFGGQTLTGFAAAAIWPRTWRYGVPGTRARVIPVSTSAATVVTLLTRRRPLPVGEVAITPAAPGPIPGPTMTST